MPIPILMPALSPTMEEGNLSKWLVKEGDAISSGDLLAEIETDKATMEVEAVDDGVMGKILVPDGAQSIRVNETIALILEEGEDASALAGALEGGAPSSHQKQQPAAPVKEVKEAAPESAPGANAAASPPATAAMGAISGGNIKASPLARRLAAQSGLDLASLTGSGPNGRIIKRDIEAAAPGVSTASASDSAEIIPFAPSAAPQDLGIQPGTYDEVPLDTMRKTVARRMTQSKQQVPHFPLTVDCTVDKLLAMRKDLNARAPQGEEAFKISVNDFVIRAAALALKKVPDVNASFSGDKRLLHHHADIAVAVALEGGLITPIIWQADTKGLREISDDMKDKAARAKSRKLMPEEYQGGTFSISNLGMYGIKEFAAIINQPHGAILAVGAGEPRPVVKDGALGIATVMTCTLSLDHRVVDGALGATWLQAFKGYIEDPVTMLL